MAKINNQAVVQKLIDELKLYPGADSIPTEIADKILAVYQINSETIDVTSPTATIVRETNTAGAGTTTIYTTPANQDFYLTGYNMAIHATAAGAGIVTISATIDGVVRDIQVLVLPTAAAIEYDSVSMNLSSPVKIDRGTNITITNSAAALTNYATIFGYIV